MTKIAKPKRAVVVARSVAPDDAGATGTTRYQKGARLERLARASLQRQGYRVMRSAGSKGAIDLVAWNTQEVRFIQCKSAGATRPKDRKALEVLPRPAFATVELWERSGLVDGFKVEVIAGNEIADTCSHGAVEGECKIATCLYAPLNFEQLPTMFEKIPNLMHTKLIRAKASTRRPSKRR